MFSWIFFALLSAIFASLVAIFGKIGISQVDSTLATTLRVAVMLIFLLLVSLFMGKFELLASVKNRAMFFIILSGLAGALSWLFYFFALRHGPATGVVAFDRLSILFVLILSFLFLGEKLTWPYAWGAILMTMGALLMVLR